MADGGSHREHDYSESWHILCFIIRDNLFEEVWLLGMMGNN